MIKRIAILIFVLLLLILLGAAGIVGSVYIGLFGKIPDKEDLGKIQNYSASQVFTSDSVLIGNYFIENRTTVKFEEIPPIILNALVATEDVRFYKHEGIDMLSLARVFIKSILLGDRSAGGGSTISQQLAKNLFPRKKYFIASMLITKIKESITAIRLENIYKKEELLSLYLNTVSFGEEIYGIETASRRYFDTTTAGLKLQEAAVLVGMLKATNFYNPRLFPENALKRRNIVLGQMDKYGFLADDEADSLMRLPLDVRYNKITHDTGTAAYFREKIRLFLEEELKKINPGDGKEYNLYTDGLTIYTTINYKMQTMAEIAAGKHMRFLQKQFDDSWKKEKPWDKEKNILTSAIQRTERYKALKAEGFNEKEIQKNFDTPLEMEIFSWKGTETKKISPLDSLKYYLMLLQTGLVVMEPSSGHLKAWVGGTDYEHFKYDHVGAKRQVGSTFKPILYAAALKSGVDPCDYIQNEKRIYEEYENWSPGNADEKYEGKYSMQGGLTYSVNTIAAELIMKTGVIEVINLAKSLGITSEIPEVPSIALGTADISLLEMTGAYSIFANRGVKVNPVFILQVADREGNIIVDNSKPAKKERALDQTISDITTYFMQSVVDSGTASSLRKVYRFTNAIAGKTGTTQSGADGWFVGFTPNLVAGSWVGADDPSIHFPSLAYGQGGKMALPIWALFMQQLFADPEFAYLQNDIFPMLPNNIQRKLDCPFYKEETFWDNLFNRESKKEERKERKESKQKKSPREKIRKFFKGE